MGWVAELCVRDRQFELVSDRGYVDASELISNRNRLGQADCWMGGNARGIPTSWVGFKRLRKRANRSRSRNVLRILGFRAESSVARGSLRPWRAGNHPLRARIRFRSGLRAAYVAGHPPRLGTRRRPRRSATSLSRPRLAAKKPSYSSLVWRGVADFRDPDWKHDESNPFRPP